MEERVLTQLETTFKRGEYGQLIFRCDELLAAPQEGSDRAHILFWKGLGLLQSGHAWWGQAMSCFREGIGAAGRSRPIKARLMAALGRIYADQGDAAAFEKLMADYTKLARNGEPAVHRWGVWVWHNYGTALFNSFRFTEAASAFTRCAELARQFDLTEMLGRALHDLGGSLLELGNIAEAALAMSQAESLLPDDAWGHKKLSRRAEYFLAAGDLTSAHQLITTALLHPRIDDMTRADVYYTWARTLQGLRRENEATEKALMALDYAAKAVHYPGLHKTNQLLRDLNVPSGAA